MKNKPLTEKQHFVPQFYLRNFTNQDKKLYIFNTKERRAMKSRSASGVCYDHFFYASETGKPDKISQEVEDFFSAQIEDPLSKEMPIIIKKLENNEQIFENEKYTLAMLMNTMWLRNPIMRKQLNDMEEKIIKRMNKIRYSHPSINSKLDRFAVKKDNSLSKEEREDLKRIVINEKYSITFSNKSHLKFMLDAKNMRGFTNLFFGQYWIVHISKCDRYFVTSDNPVTVVVPPRKGPYGSTFLERTHFFSLSPTIAIEAIYPYKNSGKKLKRKIHFKGNEKAIDNINLHIAGQAEYLYASRPDEIEWFERYVENRKNSLKKIISIINLDK